MYQGKIIKIAAGSLAEELGLVIGDKILEINNIKLHDIIDVSFAFADEAIDMLVEHEDGEQEMLSFDKDYDEELGVEFQSAVFNGIRRCANHCYFCFVDQVAPNMRDSLYIKDDDYRMSFLYGNFVTLTNMGEADFHRIGQYHLSPLFVSIQATNPELRAQMLRCKRAAMLGSQLDRLQEADVEFHGQVVLCPGLNDGPELERTIRDITARQPHAKSLAIVPVGLTKFRGKDCYPLRVFNAAEAAQVIDQVRPWQEKMRQETGTTFIYLGDEFYFLAHRPLPPAEEYDGFPQLSNGIGLARNFLEEWRKKQEESPAAEKIEPLYLEVVSGTSVADMMQELADSIDLPGLHVRVIGVENKFFGPSVNVSGLLTGQDIIAALQQETVESDGKHGIILPECALRTGENVFLDDYTLQDVARAFPGVRIETVQGGADFYQALAHWQDYHSACLAEAEFMWQSNAAYTKPARRKEETG
jgi:putative radical SAM enzyme (TIGR03279 family)